MFGIRRFPVIGWLFAAWLVFALVGSVGGGVLAAIIGFGLLLPIFLLKVMFLFAVLGFVSSRFGGGGRCRPEHHVRPRGGKNRRDEPAEPRDPQWEQNVRKARDELDEMYPDEPITAI